MRAALLGAFITAGLALAGCGLENRPGALGAAPADVNTPVPNVIRPGSASPSSQWEPFVLTPQVTAWLPTGGGWDLAEQGTNASGGAYLRLSNDDGRLTVLVQATQATPGTGAATVCAEVMSGALAEAAATDIEPEAKGNPLPGDDDLDAFTCAASGVVTPRGTLDYRLDVLVRAADGVSYLQLVHLSEVGDEDARNRALTDISEMLGRAAAELAR